MVERHAGDRRLSGRAGQHRGAFPIASGRWRRTIRSRSPSRGTRGRRPCRADRAGAGRTYDFAQWYPKVAVYDRGGWEPNPLVPAGELYGEYGTYDVTMIVRDDQVLASTGVPVSGDPGWARVSRTGPPRLAAQRLCGFGRPRRPRTSRRDIAPCAFSRENVHHFAWSASPDYRYEGGVYVRQLPATHFRRGTRLRCTCSTSRATTRRGAAARPSSGPSSRCEWLESIWGPYAYPQITQRASARSGRHRVPDDDHGRDARRRG